jgi:hypothetical protein
VKRYNVIAAVATWLQALDQDFFAKAFTVLVLCWDKSLSMVKKYC